MTYQQINSSALEILSLMASEAEFGKVTISSTAVGNAIGVKQETARRNMRSLVDMNLLEVVAKDEVIMEVTADPTDVFSVGDGVVKARRVHVVEELRWKW